MTFALDTPASRKLDQLTRFSGWCLNDDGLPADRIFLRVDGTPVVQMERLPRHDLVNAFPHFGFATQGGFAGDLPLPSTARKGDCFRVELLAQFQGRSHSLMNREYAATCDAMPLTPRLRSYEIADLLESGSVPDMWNHDQPKICWPAGVLAVPHFHDSETLPTIRVLETGQTNDYSSGALQVINQLSDNSVFIDLGCGIRRKEDVRRNGLYLDAVHFRGVDVVSTRSRLPFRDNCVDAVVSLSVFEHLPDPFSMANEIFRVLRPGGIIWIETAFMQPLHADPSHYFNMTMEGLLRTFSAFLIEEYGVLPHQSPSYSLRMQFNHVMPYLRDETWKQTLNEWLAKLYSDGGSLDEALGPIGRNTLAAGVYLRGRKP